MPIKQLDLLKSEKQTSIKKMLTFFLDYLFLVILGVLLTILIATPILKTTNVYNNSYNEMEVTSVECYKIQCEAKLSIKKDEKSILNESELFDEYVNSHILLSYSYHVDQFNEASIQIDDTSKKASFDNDYLGYYYSQYKLDKNIEIEDYNGQTGINYFISLIKDGNCDSFFEYHENDLPSIKAEIGIDLFKYKNGAKSSSYYSSFKDFFINLNRKGLIELTEYAPYKEQYDQYINAYERICKAQSKTLLIVYSSLYIAMLLLPSVISGNGVTLGALITKTRTRYEKNKIASVIVDNVLTYILMFTSIGFTGLFSFGIASLSIKLFYNVTILTFVLAALIILIADFIITSFVPKNVTLVELASFETKVDVHKSIKKEEEQNETDQA